MLTAKASQDISLLEEEDAEELKLNENGMLLIYLVNGSVFTQLL